MILSASTVVRAMRGESQSYLLGTNDGSFFVTKFAGRAGARRQLINEWLGSKLLSRLGLATPSVRIVEITAHFIAAHRDKLAATGLEPSSLQGLHFGSQFPGDPATSVVFDYLPDRLLARVENLRDFIGTLVVDLWCGKTTPRQAVFVRSRQNTKVFQALMIDNDEMFGGESWHLEDATAPKLHLSLAPYATLAGMAAIDHWLSKIQSIPEAFFFSLASSFPADWAEGDGLALMSLFRRLSMRRIRLRSLALTYLRSNSKLFPQWVEAEPDRVRLAASTSTESTGDWFWRKTRELQDVISVKIAPVGAAPLNVGGLNCVEESSLPSRLSIAAAYEMMVPPVVVNAAKAILVAKHQEREGLAQIAFRRIRAILQSDSMFDLQPAGARCLPLGCGSRRLLFRANEYSVDLSLEAEPEQVNWSLVGQLSNDDDPSDGMANLPVLAMAGKKLVGKTFTNEFGEFILPDLPRRQLHLRVPLAAEGQQIDLALSRFLETPDPERN